VNKLKDNNGLWTNLSFQYVNFRKSWRSIWKDTACRFGTHATCWTPLE